MATTAFTSFLPEILPQVPSCSDILAVNAVRNACIEFCNGSLYWQETQDPITLSDTDLPYDLEAPQGAQVVVVLGATDAAGNIITPKSTDWLDGNLPNWRAYQGKAFSYLYQPNPDQVSFVPLLEPGGTNTVTLRVAYTPLRTATGVESYVYQNYLEEIAAGARARLFDMPGQPWSNEAASLKEYRVFGAGIANAAAEVNKSYSRTGMQVQFRRYG